MSINSLLSILPAISKHMKAFLKVRQNKYIIIGFSLFAIINILLSSYIHTSSNLLYTEAENAITQIQKKKRALFEMTAAAKERSILLLEMYITDDVFRRNEILTKLNYAASHFIKNKQIFEEAKLSIEEEVIFSDVMQQISTNVPLQTKAAEMLIEDKVDSAGEILFHRAIPNQTKILIKFNELNKLIEDDSKEYIVSLKNQLITTNRYVFSLVVLVICSAFAIFIVIYIRFKNREKDLNNLVEERTRDLNKISEQARSLVNNTSDAIISIDKSQNIIMFNHAAEEMFHYNYNEIIGKPLALLLPDDVKEHHHKFITEFENDSLYQSKMMGARPEVCGKRRDGSTFPAEASICKYSIDDEIYYTAFVRDITDRRDSEEEIRRLAMIDSLTGLDNRHYFEANFNDAIAFHNRYPEHQFSLLLIDLDLFKQVNDNYGHPIGDKVLKIVAQILRDNLRAVDRVGRLGGDEFAILLQETWNQEQVVMIAKKLIQALSQPHSIDGHVITIGASIGIAICPETNAEMEEMFKNADKMLYLSKAEGRNTFRIYSP